MPFKILIVGLILLISNSTSFKEQQKRYPRVRQAYADKQQSMEQILDQKGLEKEQLQIYLRAFKQEREIELWGKAPTSSKYQILKTYAVCSTSGNLGPKRKQGDLQIPEGFYHINRFNPSSNFYLSLGLNYPNKADKILGNPDNLGGDIFVHGACVTIGCLPITNDQIKELYILAVEAKNNGQQTIPITIFPKKLTGANYQQLLTDYVHDQDKLGLWADLKVGYDYFNEEKALPRIGFLANGRHTIR